jgi:hypothetical protein
LKHRHGSFLLAVVLSTAAPAFADRIPADFRDGDRDSVSMQWCPHKKASQARNLGLSTFKEDEFCIEFSPSVPMSDFRKDGKISDVRALRNSGPGSDNRQMSLFDLDSKHGDSFGRDHEQGRWKHNENERDWDDDEGPRGVVATPEPGSQTLLLFGLAGLGIIMFRRNALKNAI